VTTSTSGTTDLSPQVTAFLARVRAHLSDLPEEERDELLDGLEADLAEQHAEGGALPDPTAYAAELRAAAGLPPSKRRLRPNRTAKELYVAVPDVLRDSWFALVRRDELLEKTWRVVEGMRPAWWVLRAWVAVTWLDVAVGRWEQVTLLPSLAVPLLGPALFVAASVVSVLIGQGRLWPGSGPDRSTAARWLLGGLNLLAVLVPLAFVYPTSQPQLYQPTYARAVAVHDGPPVLRLGRDVVRNVYAYDADGQPLQGVQLFDQKGRPVAVSAVSSMGAGADRQVTCPWFNGTTPLFNVFPLPERAQRHGTCLGRLDPAKVGPQGFHAPPLAAVPPVSLPTAMP
jgi:hypothetical protein